MLLTQSKAIAEIRSKTGLSEKSAADRVKEMRKIQDGCRRKVHSIEVEKVIAEVNAPPVPLMKPVMRSLSAKKKEQIRLYGLPPRRES